MIFQKVKIGSICTLVNGIAFKSGDFQEEGIPVLKIANVKANNILLDNLQCVSEEIAEKKKKGRVYKGDILLTMTGNRKEGGPDSWVGKAALFRENGHYMLNQRLCIVRPDTSKVNTEYLAYYLSSWDAQLYFINHSTSSGGQANISPAIINDYEVALPSLEIQRKIAHVLNMMDLKIRANVAINGNLSEQVQALYRHLFVESCAELRQCRADEFFDITIGKTPPRKEKEWFSTSENDVRWFSISDMGKCGTYISSCNEYLTKDAVEKFNVVVVPENTVLLSFKLTVGRIAITACESTTNEAIAHFKTQKKEYNPYLYCYLNDFNFEELGSTSSIATAVNSKIIKSMPFIIPDEGSLEKFNEFSIPAFAQLRANQEESERLTALRDILLPKLMSGELDVSDLEI